MQPRTVDELVNHTVRLTPDHVSRHEVELMLWKFIELLAIYDGPVTIYPDKQIRRFGSLYEYELGLPIDEGL